MSPPRKPMSMAEKMEKMGFGKYRIGWRGMAACTGYRTLYPALIPPGAQHTHGVFAVTTDSWTNLVTLGVTMSSLISDFFIRTATGSNIRFYLIDALPRPAETKMMAAAGYEFLRMNCITKAYAPFWEHCTGTKWSTQVPLRNPLLREKALAVMDVAHTLSLGMSLDDLITIYESQFPVMRRYDRELLFDAQGYRLPAAMAKKIKPFGFLAPPAELTRRVKPDGVIRQYEPPFTPFDRVAFWHEVARDLYQVQAGMKDYTPLGVA